MIEQLITKLDDAGILDETYIFFTTDNGFHISQYRMHPGKECGFDTDIHIPLIVRGPGIARNASSHLITSHTDIAPTILQLAGTNTRPDFDGLAIPLTEEDAVMDAVNLTRGEHVNVEFWGDGLPEGRYGVEIGRYANNTYKALRLVGETYSLYYSVWCTGEREYYDLRRDPAQMENLLAKDATAARESYEVLGRGFDAVVDRLDALLVVLKTCKGRTCTHPWEEHGVQSLKEALRSGLDGYFAGVPKVAFSKCVGGYVKEIEGDRDVSGLGQVGGQGQGQVPFRYTGSWHDWV